MHQGLGDDRVPGRGPVPGEAHLVVGLAHIGLARPARRAVPARDDPFGHHRGAGGQRAVPGGQRPAGQRSAGQHGPAPFVPQHEGVADVRGVDPAGQDVQVGAAQPDGGGPDQHLTRPRDRAGLLLQRHLPGGRHDQRPASRTGAAGRGGRDGAAGAADADGRGRAGGPAGTASGEAVPGDSGGTGIRLLPRAWCRAPRRAGPIPCRRSRARRGPAHPPATRAGRP